MCGPDIVSSEDKARIAARNAAFRQVSRSPFGEGDEIGMLNLIDSGSIRRVLSEIDPGKVFDLATDYFIGMPNWVAAGDPAYQIWMSHTPRGTVRDDPMHLGQEQNELVSYSGDCITMYTHCGTHVDALNHYGYHGEIWNGFTEAENLGTRHWHVAGVDKHPPIVARGIVLDVAGAHGVDVLPDSYAIGQKDLEDALARQGTELRVGDVVLVRTGRMKVWSDAMAFMLDEPGLDREGAEFLAKAGAVMIGADNIAVEAMPTADPMNWQVVHTYLFCEAGVPILEMANLEELAGEEIYEFAFVGACIKLRGATASPIRPMAFPIKK